MCVGTSLWKRHDDVVSMSTAELGQLAALEAAAKKMISGRHRTNHSCHYGKNWE